MRTEDHPADADPLSLVRTVALFRRLGAELLRLGAYEARSAGQEIGSKFAGVGKGAVAVAGALILLVPASFALTICVTLALALVVAPWVAALIVAVGWLAIAATFGLLGYAAIRGSLPLVPQRTIQSVKENIEWAKHQVTSVRG